MDGNFILRRGIIDFNIVTYSWLTIAFASELLENREEMSPRGTRCMVMYVSASDLQLRTIRLPVAKRSVTRCNARVRDWCNERKKVEKERINKDRERER